MTNTNALLASELSIETKTAHGRDWARVTARGWNTGWCSSSRPGAIHAAIARATAYCAGEQVSESPAGQVSWAEMQSLAAWRVTHKVRGMSLVTKLAAAGAPAYDTDEWLQVSAVDLIKIHSEGWRPSGEPDRKISL